MAKFCEICKSKLPFLSWVTVCKECRAKQEEEEKKQEEIREAIKTDIIRKKEFTKDQASLLMRHKKESQIKLYNDLFDAFKKNGELGEDEINILSNIQNAFYLSSQDIKYDERIKPYIYINSIKKDGKLPNLKLSIEGGSPPVLKKNEILHHADNAILSEMKSVSLGYKGGSHGVSIPFGKGFRYRIGSHKGHIQREDRIVETSRGIVFLSNQRLFLHPKPGNKPLNIPLNKILSYHCYGNGIELYKEGREKGYFLSFEKSESVDIFGICLAHLLNQQ
ncbi:MAG: hypothetical protein WCC06_12125 [Candidatus Aminicenantales bacterium]